MNRPRYKEPSVSNIVDGQFFIKNQQDKIIHNNDGEELIGAVIDNNSIVKRNLGKLAYGAELSAGIEQLLHPEIGAAVEHTGKFWRNPYYRVAVSMDPIMNVVYADNPRLAGEYVRRLHEGIHGVDAEGKKFNALSSDAFYWAHETFRSGVEKTADFYSKSPFTDADKAQLQLESTTWYSYYGMPMGHTPADVAANEAYRSHMINDVLTLNPSARRAIDMALERKPPRPETVPRRAWWLAKVALMPVTEMMSLVTIGELDPSIRKRFEIPFDKREQKKLEDLRLIVRELFDTLPDPLRYSPKAYDALRRERGGEHRNVTDLVTYTGLSLGAHAAKRTVMPVIKQRLKRQAAA